MNAIRPKQLGNFLPPQFQPTPLSYAPDLRCKHVVADEASQVFAIVASRQEAPHNQLCEFYDIGPDERRSIRHGKGDIRAFGNWHALHT